MCLLQDINTQTQIMDIAGWLSREEGLLLYRLAKKQCHSGPIVEIGSFKGKSTVFIASALREEKKGQLFAIDPHKGETIAGKKDHASTYTAFLKNIKRFQVNKYVFPIKKTSEAANKGWKKHMSLLFIDGLHEYQYAKQDLQLWLPHLREGGVVACHDAYSPYPEVFRAVQEELFHIGNVRYISFANSIIYAVKGKPETNKEKLILVYNIFFFDIASYIWHGRIIPASVRDFLVTLIKKIIIKQRVFDENVTILRDYS